MTEIIDVFAREILDSRGNPTIEVDIELADGSRGRASVPAGATIGAHEALELRDKDAKRYGGLGVQKAVGHIRDIIAPELRGLDATAQDLVDRVMCHLDDTENKAMLGANAILAVSYAVAKAASNSLQMPLYRYLGGVQANGLPVPVCCLLAGGRHADNGLDFQEFSIAPVGLKTFSEAIRASSEVFRSMRGVLRDQGYSTAVADDGGFAPPVKTTREALDLVLEAVRKAGYAPGEDFYVALDCAASALYDAKAKSYRLSDVEGALDGSALGAYYDALLRDYPIFVLEDAFDARDWESWSSFTSSHGHLHVIGDDLLVTNGKLLQQCSEKRAANGIVIKPNQLGTLTETLDVLRLAKKFGFSTMLSHRTGETEETFLSDLSVATNCRLLKCGGLARSERMAKYNQLLRIEEQLGEDASYVGRYALRVKQEV